MTIKEAWSKETSSDPSKWSNDNPSWGQCAVTALLIQDWFGGDLLRAMINGISHYWNRLPNGIELDLTCEQFGKIESKTIPVVRDRSYVLSFPETVKRYQLLKNKVEEKSGV